MSWVIAKEFTFEAAHRLPLHSGKCFNLHGHSWKCLLYVQGESLTESGSNTGMVMDYADIKKVFKPILEGYLDHHYLNETLEIENPTSEAIAKWIYDRVKPKLPTLVAVQVNETCTSRCFYTKSDLLPLIGSNALTLG